MKFDDPFSMLGPSFGGFPLMGSRGKARTLVVIGGDSISVVNSPTWPSILGTYLGSDYTVTNHSTSGHTIADGNTAFAAGVGATLSASTASNKIAICQLSTNSLAANVSVATCKSQLTTWVNAAKAAGADRVLVCTTLARGDLASQPIGSVATFVSRADELAAWIRNDTDSLGIEELDFRADYRLSDYSNTTAFDVDTVHQTQAGNRWLAQDAYAQIVGVSDSDGTTWNSRISAAGGTQSAGRQTANIRLMQRLNLSSIKSKVCIGTFDTANAGGNAILSDRATPGTFSGSNTHGANDVTFGAGNYFDSGYNPSVSGYGGLGVMLPDTISTSLSFDIGCFLDAGYSIGMSLNLTGPTLRADYGNNTAAVAGALVSGTAQTAAGLYMQYLGSSTNGKLDRYLSSGNTAILNSTIGGVTNGTSLDKSLYVGGLNGTGGPFASARKYGYWFAIKSTLTAAEVVDLKAALEAWKRERLAS